MDSILFYGEKNEASRRQVRSAAAQHSHRTGPRKAKTSKRPRADSHGSRRRKARRTSAGVAAPVTQGSAGKSIPIGDATGASNDYQHGPMHAGHDRSLPSPIDHQTDPWVFQNAMSAALQQERRKASAGYGDWQSAQPSSPDLAPMVAQLRRQPSSLPPLSMRLPPPAPSPTHLEHSDRTREDMSNSSHSRNNSHISPRSPTMRLPQYSWTEYPRYGLGQNAMPTSSQMLTQVVTDRDVIQQSVPGTTWHNDSEFQDHEESLPSVQHPQSGDQSLARQHQVHQRPSTSSPALQPTAGGCSGNRPQMIRASPSSDSDSAKQQPRTT